MDLKKLVTSAETLAQDLAAGAAGPMPQVQPQTPKGKAGYDRLMDALVQQLLTLSRIEAAAKVQFDAVVNVPAMLQLLEQEANSLNREKQHKLVFQVDPNLQVTGITEELRASHPDIAFFEQRNPGWQRGNELPCIARADFFAFLKILPPFLMKTMFGGRSRSATDANVNAGETARQSGN